MTLQIGSLSTDANLPGIDADSVKQRAVQTGLDTIRLQLHGAQFASSSRRLVDKLGWLHMKSGGRLHEHWNQLFVEASIPSLLYGINYPVADLVQARNALRVLIGEATEYAEIPETDIDALRIMRIDIAMDFPNITNISSLLRSLETVARRRDLLVERKSLGYGRSLSLTVRTSRSWAVRLYDKGKESEGLVPEDTLRAEVQLRRRRLQTRAVTKLVGNIDIFGDLTDRKLELLAEATTALAGFDRTLTNPLFVVDQILDSGEYRCNEALRLLGLLMVQAVGRLDDLSAHPQTIRDYKKLLTDSGLVIDLSNLQQS